MSAVTYTEKTLTPAKPQTAGKASPNAAPATGVFARLWTAVMESRMEEARRELALYVDRYGREPIIR